MSVLLRRLLSARIKDLSEFKPDKAFFDATGIKKRRFKNLLKGNAKIKGKEYAAIAAYFKITPREASETRQIGIFEGEARNDN